MNKRVHVYWQWKVRGGTMGGPISEIFPDKYMCKMEFDVVVAGKPLFHAAI